ncbi:MAG: glyoxalase [Saprospiraceae bacterium]|nr:glyoxalase [Saprospiraceae bacterium]
MKASRESIKSIRPDIPSITEQHAASAAEQFQNKTLRPILKLQNDLLVALFQDYITLRKGKFHTLSHQGKAQFIKNSLQKDQKFKHLLLGCILGHFTPSEYTVYQTHKAEISRRITTLLIQRLQDQLLNSQG